MKFVRSVSVTLSANESKEIEKFVGKTGETIKLISVTFSASSAARLLIYHNQTKIVDVVSDFVPDINSRIELNLTAEPGDEIVVQVENLSGSSNTVKVYYEYERTTR